MAHLFVLLFVNQYKSYNRKTILSIEVRLYNTVGWGRAEERVNRWNEVLDVREERDGGHPKKGMPPCPKLPRSPLKDKKIL
jgi:hypothetical protein